MKALRLIFFAGLALILTTVIGASIFIATFDANRYKPEIEQLVFNQTGRTLRIEGNIELTIFPTLGVKLERVTLTEKDPKIAFVTATSATASIALIPLLQRQVSVHGLMVDGLTVNVVRGKDGRFNLTDLWSDERDQPKAQQSNQSGSQESDTQTSVPVQFDIQSIAMSGASINYRDHHDRLDLAVTSLNVHTGRLASDATGKLALSAKVASKSLALKTDLSLTGEYILALGRYQAELKGLQLKTQGQWQDFQALDIDMSMGIGAKLDSPSYTATDLLVRVKAQDGNQTAHVSAESGGVTISKTAVTVKPSKASLELTVDTEADKQTITAAIGLPSFEYIGDSLSVGGLDATLAISNRALNDKPWSTAAKGDLTVDVKQETLSTGFKGQMDGSPFTATLGIRQFSAPALTFDIELDGLNLDRFGGFDGSVKAATAKADPVSNSSWRGTAAPSPVDFSALKGPQAKGRLRIKQITHKGLALNRVDANILLEQGRLSADPHSAELLGGKLSGSLLVDSNVNRIALKETLSNIQVDALLTSLGQTPRITGVGSLTMDLNTTGKTSQAFEQNLTGNATVQLRDGTIKGIDIGAILNTVRSLLGKAPTQQGATGGQTAFTEMKASVAIANGIATNRDLSVKAPMFRAQGNGSINFRQGSVDYLAKVAVVETSTGQGGADLAKLRGVTIPVRITGQLDKPTYQVDISALAADLAKSQLGDKAQQEINKVVPGLGDALKGLFGR